MFSWYKVLTLRFDKRENDFFHFVSMLNNKDTVLDIGANLGFMTYHMAKKVSGGVVFSFEPIPENINTINRIKKFFRLGNVKVQDYALGNMQTSLKMIMPVKSHARKQGLSHVVNENIAEEGIMFEVEQNRLDDLKILNDLTIQGIKIDVENYEFEVFKGATELLKKNKPVIYCELWDNENRYNCFALLSDIGYQVKVLINGKLHTFNREQHFTQNFFFVPDNFKEQ